MRQQEISALLQQRADDHVAQNCLIVDYYRIRRQVAIPLPMTRFHFHELRLPEKWTAVYPWATWQSWALEERIATLGWAGQILGRPDARELCLRDLEALTGWERYHQYDSSDLSSAHYTRTMLWALRYWPWAQAALQDKIVAACARSARLILPLMGERLKLQHPTAIVDEPKHRGLVHNISIIHSLMLACAARSAGLDETPTLERYAASLVLAMLELRNRGRAEGVAYDGYIIDFVADWLDGAPADLAQAILDHPQLTKLLWESVQLAAPGNLAEVAQLADVEPKEMPFHLSAHAKLARDRGLSVCPWHLTRCPLNWWRTDALAALYNYAENSAAAAAPPRPGVIDAHYALVLRTGWEPADLAVAAASNTQAPALDNGHLHHDGGSLVLATTGRWLISDPGYQQYLPTTERDFTIGGSAHNCPRIGGTAQSVRASRILTNAAATAAARAHDALYGAIDMTRCYFPPTPPAGAAAPAGESVAPLALTKAVRHFWLAGRELLVVADEIVGPAAQTPLGYCWHGHPQAAWGVENGWALLYLERVRLWVGSPHLQVLDRDINRLRGSRGQLSISREIPLPHSGLCWWVFALQQTPPNLAAADDGRALQVGARLFRRPD